ncbi:hypothetical protein DPEC_G00222280, partial [Dallia pectoralis]
MPRERWQGEDYYWDNYEFRRPRQRRLSPSPTGRRYNRSQFNNYEYDGRSYAEVARAARSRMPNPTEQQWAPRGNTRAQFNDNRRGPRRREDRSYPRRRRYDDHRQKERRRPSRDQGLQEKMVNTVRTRDTPQPRLEERRQMVSTQTMTEDEPPPPVPEVRNYKQTVMVEVHPPPRRAMDSVVLLTPEPRSRSGNVDWTTRTTPAHEEQSEGQLEREGDGNSSPLFLSPSPHSPVLPFVSLPLLGPSALTSFQVPREQRRGQRSRESTSGIREPQQGEPTLQTIDEDPGEATTNQEGPFVPPVVMTPRYQGTPSQSDLSSEEELSGEEGDLDSPIPPTPPPVGSPVQTKLTFSRPRVSSPLNVQKPFRHMSTL